MSPREAAVGTAASVRARLAQVARLRSVELQLVLSEFAIERLLYRLGVSAHADRFVLKGATLLRLWSGDDRRATWDLDLLGSGESTVAGIIAAVVDLCAIPADDGIAFSTDSITGEEIRGADRYGGVRVRLVAQLGQARIPMQLDVGFGDAVVPTPRRVVLPALLDHAPPWVLVDPREAVVAEKVEAMVSLGMINSRMKDFYDVHRLAASMTFDGLTLVRALRATFDRRRTPFPADVPLVLTPGFLADPERQMQWRAFVHRGRLPAPPDVAALTETLRAFLLPILAVAGTGAPFDMEWRPGGPWMPKGSAP